jgi:hypothetical protein
MAADAIREQLGQQFPDIDALNKDYSFLRNVNRVVSDTITRRTGQAKPLGQKLAQALSPVASKARCWDARPCKRSKRPPPQPHRTRLAQ